jgi:hypothetical protein
MCPCGSAHLNAITTRPRAPSLSSSSHLNAAPCHQGRLYPPQLPHRATMIWIILSFQCCVAYIYWGRLTYVR